MENSWDSIWHMVSLHMIVIIISFQFFPNINVVLEICLQYLFISSFFNSRWCRTILKTSRTSLPSSMFQLPTLIHLGCLLEIAQLFFILLLLWKYFLFLVLEVKKECIFQAFQCFLNFKVYLHSLTDIFFSYDDKKIISGKSWVKRLHHYNAFYL